MEFSEVRPILSGILGGLVATILGIWWARWLPRRVNGKDAAFLKRQFRTAIWASNGAFLAGILGALARYRWGGFVSSDWRPIALGAGAALSAPLVILPVAAILQRTTPREAYEAYALSQGTPFLILYLLLALGVPVLAAGLIYL
jgi:hypothetical protein